MAHPPDTDILPMFAGLGSADQHERLVATMGTRRSETRLGIPSHDPADTRFDSKR